MMHQHQLHFAPTDKVFLYFSGAWGSRYPGKSQLILLQWPSQCFWTQLWFCPSAQTGWATAPPTPILRAFLYQLRPFCHFIATISKEKKEKIKVKENHIKSRLHILYKDVIFLMVIYDHWPFQINYGTAFVSGRSNLSPRITQKATQAPCFLLSDCKSV